MTHRLRGGQQDPFDAADAAVVKMAVCFVQLAVAAAAAWQTPSVAFAAESWAIVAEVAEEADAADFASAAVAAVAAAVHNELGGWCCLVGRCQDSALCHLLFFWQLAGLVLAVDAPLGCEKA